MIKERLDKFDDAVDTVCGECPAQSCDNCPVRKTYEAVHQANEIKKIYCLLTDWVCEGEAGSSVDVYATLEDADKAFRQTVEEERTNDHLYELDDCVEELNFENHTFCVYQGGYFSEDHFEARVVEREIKE